GSSELSAFRRVLPIGFCPDPAGRARGTRDRPDDRHARLSTHEVSNLAEEPTRRHVPFRSEKFRGKTRDRNTEKGVLVSLLEAGGRSSNVSRREGLTPIELFLPDIR